MGTTEQGPQEKKVRIEGPHRAVGASVQTSVEQQVRERLAEDCSYRFYFKDITLHYDQGVLTLQGRVPSFYLKQVLQTFVKDIPEIVRVDNQVDVVSATGLSSSRSN
jgi:hypothetical protein